MPEFKLSINVNATKLSESFDKVRRVAKSSLAVGAQLATAVQGMVKALNVSPTHMREVSHDVIVSTEPDDASDNTTPVGLAAGRLAEALSKIANMVSVVHDVILSDDSIGGGQGRVFRAIGRWFWRVREWMATWRKPLPASPVYAPLWFRGRTGKSTKVPVRFKGWKGGRG